MNIKWVTDLAPSKCKNSWLVKNKPVLGAVQYQAVKQAYNLNSENTAELVFNEKFVSVEQIDQALLVECKSNIRYVFLVVNKFLVYSEKDRPVDDTNYDLALLRHWQKVTGWKPVYMNYIDNDQGLVGNFVFPITQMLLERND